MSVDIEDGVECILRRGQPLCGKPQSDRDGVDISFAIRFPNDALEDTCEDCIKIMDKIVGRLA